jgi:hypothetical protein
LKEFVDENTKKFYDRNALGAIRKVQDGEVHVDKLVEQWARAFSQVSL